jgi:GNAT superfamily N-acetyltransferase
MNVEPLAHRDVAAAAAVVAESHVADPAMAWVYPDAGRRPEILAALFRLALADLLQAGHVDVVRVDDQIVGVAAWLPPGAFPVPWRRQLRSGPAFARLVARAPVATPRLMRFLSAATSAFPAEPRWQLNVVGVRPDRQGRGVGTALVGHRMYAVANRIHLETWNPANLPFYGRFGFAVAATDEPLGPDGPRRWTLAPPSASPGPRQSASNR